MNCWGLEDVKKEDRRAFIIKCLNEYIEEAEKIAPEDSPYMEHIEIRNVINLYKAIIDELGGEEVTK